MLVARWWLVASFLIGSATVSASEPTDFFEQKIRPLLVEHCAKCHGDDQARNGKEPKGGLRTDGRAALLLGGETGPAVVPGDLAKSKLIEAVRYANADMLMPPKGKLPDAAIRDLETWVKAGAVWPNDKAETGSKSTFDLAKRKGEHWCWKPMLAPPVPLVTISSQAATPVDRFLLAQLQQKNLKLAPAASKSVWLRRVTFALIGLPPTTQHLSEFENDTTPEAFAKVVDRLLATPQFGERWGRHWLDLVRFAESRGHEFEPDIPNAWQYRDYVVRALNSDVPYDQFVRENIAGDVLPKPRLNPVNGANESILGSGFWHLGEEVHSPVDIRQDQADRFDNRIDVASKTFLGLTVACARCHDHKFDAISTKDYYALYGLLEGSAYRQVRFDGWDANRIVAAKLAKLRADTTQELSDIVQISRLTATVNIPWQTWRAKAETIVDYGSNTKTESWFPDDVTFGTGPRPAGTLSLDKSAKVRVEPYTAAVFDPFWAGLKTSADSAPDFGPLGKINRVGFSIRTPNFVLTKKKLYYLVRGGGMAYAGVNGHTLIAGPLHGNLVHTLPNSEPYRWVSHDLSGYIGQRMHVELSADPSTEFAVAMVLQSDEAPPSVPQVLAQLGTVSDADAIRTIAAKVTESEKNLAKSVTWASRIALATWDGTPVDEAVFVRGNPRSPGAVVPHRSLEAIAGTDGLQHTTGSGRLELAQQWIDAKQNPFAARVAVNRIWHQLFGRGLVPTPDNFGLLGEAPTHPELLDYLATEFVTDGWSQKRLIRRLVLTDAYRMSSECNPDADSVDPTNVLLHKFRLKRLEGEAIRDSMLRVSGRLDPKLEGKSVPIFLTAFLDGRGRPVTGPLDGNGRRSLYLAVRRNFLSPFLQAFDTPIPFSTVGRRQVSNVPAQALILLNDPFVFGQAEVWAKAVLSKPGTTTERLDAMYLSAFARLPTVEERSTCTEFLKGQESNPKSWADLGHMLFNVKEFIYIR